MKTQWLVPMALMLTLGIGGAVADAPAEPATSPVPPTFVAQSAPPGTRVQCPGGDGLQEEILRLGALLGVTEGPATLLIKGPAARFAAGIAELIGGVEVVGLESGLSGEQESEGVSRMVAYPRIPFFSDTFKGILLSGETGDRDLEEAARVVAPSGRVVVLDASPELSQRVEALGLKILLQEDGVLVAQHQQIRFRPLVTLRGL